MVLVLNLVSKNIVYTKYFSMVLSLPIKRQSAFQINTNLCKFHQAYPSLIAPYLQMY